MTAYTPGYRQLARELEESVRAHGLPFLGFPYESRGSWLANLRIKPEVLLAALWGRSSAVWIDADAVLRGPPVLFDELEREGAEVAFHVLRKVREPLGGTIWTASRAFLRSWLAIIDSPTYTAELDQVSLPEAVERSGARFRELPREYCWLDYFTHPRWGGPGEPVVEHKQASRAVRRGEMTP